MTSAALARVCALMSAILVHNVVRYVPVVFFSLLPFYAVRTSLIITRYILR